MNRKIFLLGLALSLTAGVSVASGIIFSEASKQDLVATYAYDENTVYYVTGEFNSWNKVDSDAHMTYVGMDGNNWKFATDYPIKLTEGQKFNIVNPYNDGANWNTFCPDLMTNSTDFNHPENTDYLVANRDITVNFYYQVYGNDPSWTGLYWAEFDAAAFAFKFTDEYESICEANKNNAVGIAAPQSVSDEWTRQTKLFGYLTDANKLLVKNANSESGTELANFAAKYDYLISKYTGLANFAERTVISPFGSRTLKTISETSAATPAIVAVVGLTTLTAVGGFFLLKKKPF